MKEDKVLSFEEFVEKEIGKERKWYLAFMVGIPFIYLISIIVLFIIK